MISRKAIFVDLDGTLVRAFEVDGTTRGPRTRGEVEFLPAVAEDLWRLRDAGFQIVGVTNQPDIARGTLDPLSHRGVRLLVQRDLPVSQIYLCWHDDHWCECRKPKPGLLWQAAVEHQLILSECWMIGDRETDIQAGQAAGCRTFKVEVNQGITGAVNCILAISK